MKAARINDYGHADVIEITEIDKPAVSEGKVLVEVHAASLNPFDTTVREGRAKDAVKALPVTLGGDIAGVVIEIGADVSHVSAGDKVYGQASAAAGNSGAFAEFAVTKASQLARMPANLDFEAAASLPLVGVSALQALTEHIGLQPGQKIFIHGGSGGIGSIAVQIAKHLGAYVTASARGETDAEFVKGLGADEAINTENQDFTAVLSDYDAVFDTVGGDDFNKALEILKRGGTAVAMIAKADEAKVAELGITALTQQTRVTTEKLDNLRLLVEDGVIAPQVTETFPLENIREAFEARESGKVHGKVVLSIT